MTPWNDAFTFFSQPSMFVDLFFICTLKRLSGWIIRRSHFRVMIYIYGCSTIFIFYAFCVWS